ncbi:PA2779 family protein [Metapseudomonas resinovorans]|uniref:PA2779 family protein n=1 Tax=Metapseudomonas resinovorans TaxID=53412 RepID=UPI0003F614DC|nr:PA2779 family protein [Pseudomonas resinovorans]MDE3740051.1 PA2779 family protein [Pseudomonas resinovorans]
MKLFALIFSTVLLFVCLGLVPVTTAQAGMIGTDEAIATQQQSGDHDRIDAFLSQSEVQDQMRAMGVDAATARTRAQALTHEEAAQLAQKMNAAPAGGNISSTDFIIILLVIILVAILL